MSQWREELAADMRRIFSAWFTALMLLIGVLVGAAGDFAACAGFALILLGASTLVPRFLDRPAAEASPLAENRQESRRLLAKRGVDLTLGGVSALASNALIQYPEVAGPYVMFVIYCFAAYIFASAVMLSSIYYFERFLTWCRASRSPRNSSNQHNGRDTTSPD